MAAPIRALAEALATLRAERAVWAGADQRTRSLALLGLQYDRCEGDIELSRFLLEREVEQAETESEREELRLACFLVATARDPDDVWLLARAKLANYDTFCGLDREYLFAAGVGRTVEHVRRSNHPTRERVLGELLGNDGTPMFEEAELVEWWRSVLAYFPARPEDEPIYVAERALELGTPAEALRWLEAWAANRDERDTKRAREVATALARDPALADRVRALGL